MSPPRSDRSTRQLATDVPASDDALISHDLAGIITSWNRQAGQIFGRSETEVVGQSIRLIVPPDLYEEEDEVLRRIAAGASLDHYDTVRVRKDGQRLDVSLTVSPLAAPGGEIVGASTIARVITERKRRERDARYLVAIVDSSDDAIISKDLNGTITSWNRAAERLFGHAAGAVIGQPIRLIIPADRQAEEDRVLDIVRRGEIVDHFETLRLRKNGTLVPISLTVSPIRSATGTIVGSSKIARDLTATRRHEALFQTGALQNAIFNSVNFSSIATDPKGVIQIFNVGAERMLGYAAAEVLNTVTPADLSDPQEVIARAQALSVELSTPIAPGFEALVSKASRGIEDIYELTYIRKDGSRFPAVVSVTALRDAHRDIIGYLLIGTDNTARKRADAQLRLQGAALNAAANPMVITDRAGLIEWVNAAFSDLTGYTAAEALGENLRALVKSDHHDQAFYQNLWQTILSGQVWRGETINRRKDGSLYTEEQAITPVRDAQGEISHFIAVKQDITARNRAEEEIRQGAQRSAQAAREFRMLFAANPLPMWIYDQATLEFLEVNEAAIRRYGYERAEFLAMTIADIRPPGDVERLLTDLRQPRETWQGAGHWRHRLKSGQTIDVEITSHTITFAARSAVLVVAQDITARTHAEEEIRQRAQLSALRAAVGLSLSEIDSLAHALQRCAEALVTHLDAALARIWTLNERDGVLELQASAGLYRHLDGPHGKVPLGQFKIGRIAQNGRSHVTNSVIGDPQVHDQDWARREGIVAFAGYPLIVEGRVVGVMALFARQALSDPVIAALASIPSHIALGIEHHRSAEAVRTAEERMRFALEAAGVGIWDMDYRTGVLRWSETLEAHYGLQPGTFAGTYKALVECIHPDDRESALGVIEKAVKSGGEFQRLNRALWPDGTVRWLRGIGRILLGEHGEPVRGIGISLDVTEQRRADAELKRLNDESQVQRLQVFKATMRTVQDIVNNLLNSFHLVRLEAEGQLPAELLTLVDRTIHEAAVKLKALGDLETVNEKEMAIGSGIDYPDSES